MRNRDSSSDNLLNPGPSSGSISVALFPFPSHSEFIHSFYFIFIPNLLLDLLYCLTKLHLQICHRPRMEQLGNPRKIPVPLI